VDTVVALRAGSPGRILALGAPLGAVALVLLGAQRDSLVASSTDVVAPSVVAVVTVIAGLVLGWRAWTQRAELDESGVRCRNLLVTFDVDWGLVESLRVERRGPLVLLELVLVHQRRSHRIGAATRRSGPSSEAVLAAVSQVAPASLRLDRTAS